MIPRDRMSRLNARGAGHQRWSLMVSQHISFGAGLNPVGSRRDGVSMPFVSGDRSLGTTLGVERLGFLHLP